MPNILIVDDDEDMGEVISDILDYRLHPEDVTMQPIFVLEHDPIRHYKWVQASHASIMRARLGVLLQRQKDGVCGKRLLPLAILFEYNRSIKGVC